MHLACSSHEGGWFWTDVPQNGQYRIERWFTFFLSYFQLNHAIHVELLDSSLHFRKDSIIGEDLEKKGVINSVKGFEYINKKGHRFWICIGIWGLVHYYILLLHTIYALPYLVSGWYTEYLAWYWKTSTKYIWFYMDTYWIPIYVGSHTEHMRNTIDQHPWSAMNTRKTHWKTKHVCCRLLVKWSACSHVKKMNTNVTKDEYNKDSKNQNQPNPNDTPPPWRSREENESQEILHDLMIQQLVQHEEVASLMFKSIQHCLHTWSATKDKYHASLSQSSTMSLLSAPSQSNFERMDSSDTATPSVDSLKPVNLPSLCATTTKQKKLDATNAQSLAKLLDVLCNSCDEENAEWNDALGDAIQILSSCTHNTDDDSIEPVTVSLPHLTAVMGVKASLNVAQYLPQGLNRWKKQAKEVKSGENITKCIILLKTFMTYMELD